MKCVWGDVRTGRRLKFLGKAMGWERGLNMQQVGVPLAERRGELMGMGRGNDSQTRLRSSTRLDDESMLDSL